MGSLPTAVSSSSVSSSSSQSSSFLSHLFPVLLSALYAYFSLFVGHLFTMNQRPIPYQLVGAAKDVVIDLGLNHPHLPDADSTVPVPLLAVIGVVLPFLLVTLLALLPSPPPPSSSPFPTDARPLLPSSSSSSSSSSPEASRERARGRQQRGRAEEAGTVLVAFFVAVGTNLLVSNTVKM